MNKLDEMLKNKPERILVIRKEGEMIKSFVEEFGSSDLKIEENKVKEVKSCVALDLSHSLAYLSAGAKISEECNYDTICKETLGVEKEKLGLLEKFVDMGGVACVYDHACGILGEVGNKQGEINFGAWLSDGKVTIDGFGENVLDALNRTVEKYDFMYNENDKTR